MDCKEAVTIRELEAQRVREKIAFKTPLILMNTIQKQCRILEWQLV